MTMVPLHHGQVLFLKGREEFDLEKLTRALDPLGFEAFLTTRAELAEAEIRRTLVERGISSIWQTVIFQEELLPPKRDVPALVAVLKEMLERLAPESDLIVVDRYLFPEKEPDDYLDTLVEVLEPAIRRVQQLLVVTRKKHNAHLRDKLEIRLRASHPDCRFRHCCSEKFHDRFWIADGHRGLFVGTSLNGLGSRYALADYLATGDVRKIMTALENEGLLG